MQNWQTSLLSFLTTTAASGAVATLILWIFRSWISERLKNAIKHEYEQKLETYKSELKLETERSLAQYNYVYKECLEVYAGTYSRLAEFEGRVRAYVSFWGDLGAERAERRQEVAKALTEVQSYVLPRRIFLPAPLVIRIQELIQELYKITTKFMIFVEVPDKGSGERGGDIEHWTQVADILDKKLGPIMQELEHEFRKLLGTQKG